MLPIEVLYKERYHAKPLDQCLHLFIRRRGYTWLEATGGIEYLGKHVYVTNCIQEDAWPLKHPVYRQIDILLVLQWLIPCTARMLASHPRFVCNGLNRLYSYIPLLAGGEQRVEIISVIGALHYQVVVRKQDRVKVEAFKAAPVRGGNLQTMPRDAYSPYQPLLFGLDRSIDRATWTQSYIPLDGINQVVQLPQVDVIDAHALQGAMQLFCRFPRRASAGLGRYIEL